MKVNGYEIKPKADLSGADLSGANLRTANLAEADLRGTTLDEATADERTIWPEGFDPVAAGVTFE